MGMKLVWNIKPNRSQHHAVSKRMHYTASERTPALRCISSGNKKIKIKNPQNPFHITLYKLEQYAHDHVRLHNNPTNLKKAKVTEPTMKVETSLASKTMQRNFQFCSSEAPDLQNRSRTLRPACKSKFDWGRHHPKHGRSYLNSLLDQENTAFFFTGGLPVSETRMAATSILKQDPNT